MIRDLRAAGFDTFFKKIDSTLRGNIGAEVEGALHAPGASVAVVGPAFPAHGRTVERGRARVYGVALSEAAVGRDRRNPVACDRIADVLALQTTLPIVEVHLPPARLRRGHEAQIIVADGESEADLRAWVRIFGLTRDVLWVGSAGLAEAIAGVMARRSAVVMRGDRECRVATGEYSAILVVVGSLHLTCREQLARLSDLPGASSIKIEPANVLAGQIGTQRVIDQVATRLRRCETCILSVQEAADRGNGKEGSARDPNDGERLAAWLGEVAARALENIPPGVSLILTGGDTAHGVIEALGIQRLRVIQAAASGIPVMETLDGRYTIVTKAGGFGTAETLATIVTMLRKGK